MRRQASEEAISAYLAQVKELLEERYDFVPRRRNLRDMQRHELSRADVREKLFELSEDDYYGGPVEDHDPERLGDLWIFKKNIDNTVFYIKLKILEEGNTKTLKCISFHEDDPPWR